MQNKPTLYIYIRVSTAEQQQKDFSLPRQKDLGIKCAENLGMKYIVYEEKGESASHENFDNRPKMMEILRLVKEGVIKHLFCFDVTRLSRHDLTKTLITMALKKNSVVLYTHSKTFSFDSEEDLLTFKILEAMESYESSLRKARFALGYVSGNRKGKFLKGIPPYGYKKDKDQNLVVDPKEKKIFLKMVKMYLEKGFGTNQIAEHLNKKGIPTKTAQFYENGYTLNEGQQNRRITKHVAIGEWNPGTINRMFQSEIYIGKRKFKIGEGKYEEVKCEAILDVETFKKLRDRRRLNRISRTKKDKYFYLLKSILTCGNCGQPLHGRVKPNRGEFSYRCNSKRDKRNTCTSRGVNINKLNDAVWHSFRTSNFYHKMINKAIEEDLASNGTEGQMDSLEKELKSLEKNELKIQNEIKRLVKQYLTKRIREKVYLELLHDYETQVKLIEDNKFICNRNLKLLSRQTKSKMSDVVKGMTLVENAMEIVDASYPPKNKQEEVRARQYLRASIQDIKVTYNPYTFKHEIEVSFKKMGNPDNFPKDAVMPYKIFEKFELKAGRRVPPEKIILPKVSENYFLNDDPEFRKQYEEERLKLIANGNFIDPYSENGGSQSNKPTPPLFTQRDPK